MKKHTLLGFPENMPAPFPDTNWLFRLAGVDPEEYNNLVMMNSLYAIHHATQSGVGLATLPDYLAAQSDDLEVILEDVQPQAIDVYFVYPEERRHSQRIAIFRDFLLEHVGKTRF